MRADEARKARKEEQDRRDRKKAILDQEIIARLETDFRKIEEYRFNIVVLW